MKDKCEQFILWLQDHDPGTAVDEQHQFHLRDCESCRELFIRQEKLFEELKSSVTLSDQKRSAVEKALLQRLFDGNPAPCGFFDRLFQFLTLRRLLVPGVVVLMAIAWFFSTGGFSHGEMVIGDSSTILIDGRKIHANETKVCLNEKQKISLINGLIKLKWNGQEMISVAGRLDFVSGVGSLKVSEGKAKITFLPSSRGYFVETGFFKIEVVGTEIELEVTDSYAVMSVLHGKVRWSVETQGKQGEAQAGNRITVRNSSSGLHIIEDSMVTGPQSKSSDHNEADGIVMEKAGETWKMK
ncbi:MAG: hypothetical protein ACOYXC_20630 [Candidatus Rifleibacteriota bacterium]